MMKEEKQEIMRNETGGRRRVDKGWEEGEGRVACDRGEKIR